jgi:hypothetical protein
MEITELRSKCAQILLDGNIHFDDEKGTLVFDVSEENKILFIELAVNMMLMDLMKDMETK